MEAQEQRCAHVCPVCHVEWEHVRSWLTCPLRKESTCNPCLDQARTARRARLLRGDPPMTMDDPAQGDLFRVPATMPKTPKRGE